ncbi:hypothetical protein HPB47_002149 [Ixodes persulcatus]|uniref:Uncharacterized protein n=1 Tax=Ixodes persulcatus TaxID=34615 RepID=A0AC60PM22_IXOPE|nr:hypothetical protein HPB47_002149 [Ixodes persulcatus]
MTIEKKAAIIREVESGRSQAEVAREFNRRPLPPAVTFDKFTDMDSALDVCADLTDEEIVRQVLEPDSESDSEDDAPAIVRPSNAELTQALMDGSAESKCKQDSDLSFVLTSHHGDLPRTSFFKSPVTYRH